MASVFIHQPHFLPWLPYISRVVYADFVVFLDKVLYRKNYFQNRTVIISPEGNPEWLSVPVFHPYRAKLDEILICGPIQKRKVIAHLKHAYPRRKDPHCVIQRVADEIDHADLLINLNVSLIRLVLSEIGSKKEILFASSLTSQADPTNRIIEICSKLKAHRLVAGWGATVSAHRIDELTKAGIVVCPQSPIAATLSPVSVPGLSAIHFLVGLGPTKCAELVAEMATKTIPRDGEWTYA